MMSLTTWTYLVLSAATMYSVSSTVWCCCVTRPVAVADRWPTTLVPHCSHTVAACLTVLPAQSC
jgi:hypothetical protein